MRIRIALQFGGLGDSCFDHDCGVVLGARVQVQIVVVPVPAAKITTAGEAASSIAVRWPIAVRTFHSLITGDDQGWRIGTSEPIFWLLLQANIGQNQLNNNGEIAAGCPNPPALVMRLIFEDL